MMDGLSETLAVNQPANLLTYDVARVCLLHIYAIRATTTPSLPARCPAFETQPGQEKAAAQRKEGTILPTPPSLPPTHTSST